MCVWGGAERSSRRGLHLGPCSTLPSFGPSPPALNLLLLRYMLVAHTNCLVLPAVLPWQHSSRPRRWMEQGAGTSSSSNGNGPVTRMSCITAALGECYRLLPRLCKPRSAGRDFGRGPGRSRYFAAAVKVYGVQLVAANPHDAPDLLLKCRSRERRDSGERDFGKRDEPRRDLGRRAEPRRGEPRRDEPRRDEPRRDEPRRDEPRRDEPRRDGTAWDNGEEAPRRGSEVRGRPMQSRLLSKAFEGSGERGLERIGQKSRYPCLTRTRTCSITPFSTSSSDILRTQRPPSCHAVHQPMSSRMRLCLQGQPRA